MKYFLITKRCLVLFFLLIGFVFAQDGEWQIVSEMPLPVKGGQAIVKDSLIYIIGGYTDSTFAPTNSIQVFNPRQNSWDILENVLSTGRYGLSAANYRHEMLFFGGASGNDSSLNMWNFKDPVYTYESDENFNREFAAAQVYENDLYIFGGHSLTFDYTDSTKLPYIVKYNIPTSTFSDLNELAVTTYPFNQNPVQQMSVLLGENIFILGGALNGVLADIHRFNIPAQSWEALDMNLLNERAAGAAVQTRENTFAVIGGYNESAEAVATAEEIIDPGFGYYEQNPLPELNVARSELMAAFFDTSIYVFGGKGILGNCLSSVERLKIEAQATPVMENSPEAPGQIQLYANYPNPFNSNTVISYHVETIHESSLRESSLHVELTVYNVLGQKVQTLVDEPQQAGEHAVIFYAQNLPSGIYFYRLKIGAFEQIRKMALVR